MSTPQQHARVGVEDDATTWLRPSSGLRTLPIRLRPVPGEALDSWLEATAHRLHTHLADLLGALAVGAGERGSGDRRQWTTTYWTVQLTDGDAERIASVTGVAAAELQAMTLARYDSVALRLTAAGRVDRHHLWGRGSRSRFCPDCLVESGGRWQLWWRLGWAFACLRHRQLLADVCPACHQPQRQLVAPSHVVPQPGRCARPPAGQSGQAERRCNANLAAATVLSLPEEHPALTAQRLLLDAIDAGHARFGIYRPDPLPTASALADARALAQRLLRYATPAELRAILPADLLVGHRRSTPHTAKLDAQGQQYPGFMAPARATTTALGVTAAFTVLGAPTVQRGGAALRWLIDGCRRDGLTVSATSTTVWGRDTSPTLAAVQLAALDPILQASDRLRYRTMTDYPRHPASEDATTARRARQIPTLFWPDWSLRLWLPGHHYCFYRLVLSCGLLVVGTRLSLRRTILKLGTPSTAHGIGRVLQLMQDDASWPQVSAAVTRLADYLDAHDVPIDYERRGQLDYSTLLPDDVWIRACRRVGRPARERSAAIARAVLFERLSGLPADQAPGFVDSMDMRAKVSAFPRQLDGELAVVLDQAAQHYLRDQDIDEPATWQPPLDLLADLHLPGPDPTCVDLITLHQLVPQPGTSLEVAAARLDTTIDVVRQLLFDHPLAPRPRARQARARVRPMLTPAELLRLYQDKKLSLEQIGQRFGISKQTVATLAGEYGITLRQTGRPRKTVIDADWLYEQYVVHLRPLPELAREAGVSTMTMNRWAHTHNIPLRSRGSGSRRENLDRNGPPKQIPPRAWLYEQYVTRGRTVAELADQTGVSEAVMQRWVHIADIPTRRPGGSSHRANLPQRRRPLDDADRRARSGDHQADWGGCSGSCSARKYGSASS